jgi:hypothetical protein
MSRPDKQYCNILFINGQKFLRKLSKVKVRMLAVAPKKKDAAKIHFSPPALGIN